MRVQSLVIKSVARIPCGRSFCSILEELSLRGLLALRKLLAWNGELATNW